MTTDHDPIDPRRLLPRARDVFARAARMQDLHGQAQAQALADTYQALQAAAQQARQAAQADPVIQRLNARINGSDGPATLVAGEVIDLDLTELVPVAPSAAGRPSLGLAPPTSSR